MGFADQNGHTSRKPTSYLRAGRWTWVSQEKADQLQRPTRPHDTSEHFDTFVVVEFAAKRRDIFARESYFQLVLVLKNSRQVFGVVAISNQEDY
jgi:hypothetical protein